MVFDSLFKPFYSQEKRTGMKGESAQSFIRLAKDLREATSLTDAQATSLRLTADTDDNGVDETIEYSWSGSAGDPLERVGDATLSLVSAVTSLTFSYYDANNNLLSSPVSTSQVRAVAVDLATSTQNETFQLRSQTRLRNLS